MYQRIDTSLQLLLFKSSFPHGKWERGKWERGLFKCCNNSFSKQKAPALTQFLSSDILLEAMAFIREALERLRSGNYEAQRQQSADFIGSLPLPIAENVGALAVVLNGINRGFPDARFSLVGQRVLGKTQEKIIKGIRDKVDFLIINSAGAGTLLRERASDYLNGELHRHFTSSSGSLLRTVYESETYKVMEVCYGSTSTRFYITGKNWDDSYTFKAAADVKNNRSAILNPRP